MVKKLTYDVITLGSGTVDVFVNTHAKFIKEGHGKNIHELISYPTGSKILIDSLHFEIGGGGTNTATTFSRMGLKTGWIGKLGSGDSTDQIMNFLKSEKITFLGNVGKKHSGYSVILDSIGHDRTILTHKGENNNISFLDLDLSKLNSKWFYFSSMMEKSFVAQKKLAKYAKDSGIKLAFNPSSYQAKLGCDVLKPIISRSDVLVLNFEESKLLLKRTSSKKSKQNFIKDMLKKIGTLGPNIVIITDGPNGAYCYDKLDDRFIHVLPHKIKIIETTGAGDAFASTFVGSLVYGNTLDDSLKIALTNSESVIQNYGAKNNLLSYDDLKKSLKKKTIISEF